MKIKLRENKKLFIQNSKKQPNMQDTQEVLKLFEITYRKIVTLKKQNQSISYA